MHSGVEVCVLMELSLEAVSRVGPGIGVIGGGGCAAHGRGSFGGLKSSFGFQVPIDFNETQTMGRGKCFLTTCCRLAG